MSISVGTGVGPVRVSKRLGGKSKPTATGSGLGDTVLFTGALAAGVGFLVMGTVALVVVGYWAAVAASLSLGFSALAGIAFGISRWVPGAHAWGMRFSKVARWSWASIPALFRTIKNTARKGSGR
jgi:hypothetical protein